MKQFPNDCSTYSISVPTIDGCSNVAMYDTYNFKVYDSSGSLILDNTTNTNNVQVTFPANGTYTIEVIYTIVDNTGCTQTLSYQESFDYVHCDCQILGPPTFMDCQPGINPDATFQTLFWTPVSGAVSYEVEIILNDPTCCPNSTDPMFTFIFPRTGTSMNIPNGRCYSWIVRSDCANGTKSDWSSRSCSCGTKGGSDGSSTKSLTQFDEQVEIGELHLVSVPNPSSDYVNITLTGWSDEILINHPEIIIYEMSGKVIYRAEIALDETKRVDVSSFNSGIYLINIVDDGAILSTEKLIVE